MNTTTVALVEDNETMRQTLRELIDSAPGYRCVCACATAREALAEIPRHRPEVVLMDIHLAKDSGIACTACLTEKHPEIQVIMLTVQGHWNHLPGIESRSVWISPEAFQAARDPQCHRRSAGRRRADDQ